jgi:acetyl-CoA acetyltransferase
VAVIVTGAERAVDCQSTPVALVAAAGGHNLTNWWTGEMVGSIGAAPRAAATLFARAGVTPVDVDVAQLYAPFSIAVLQQLEEYGFCGPGEAADFVREGGTGLKGDLPTNTGGGQLSGFYATGFTPLSEGILQVRGEAPSSQVSGVELCLVSGSGGNGGIQGSWNHVSLLLGPLR